MKAPARIALGLAALFGALLSLLAGALIVAWWRPGLVLNDRNLARGQKFLQRRGHELSWSSGHLEASSLSFWDKRLRLSVTDFCFAMPDGSLRVCLNEGDVTVQADLHWKGPRLTVIGPVRVRGRELTYRAADKPAPAPAKASGETGVPYWLEAVRIHDVSIDTPWRWAQKDGAFRGTALIEGGSWNRGARWRGRASLESESTAPGARPQAARVTFNASNPVSLWSIEAWNADLEAAWNSARQSANAKARLQSVGPAGGRLDLDAHYRQPGLSAEVKVDGALKRTAAEATVNAQVRGISPRLQLVELEQCRLAAAWKAGEARDAALDVRSCKTWLTLADLRRFAERRRVRVASRVGLGWQAKFNSFVSPSREKPLRATLDIGLDALPNELLDLKGKAQATFTAEAYAAQALNASATAELEGLVTSFRALVKALARNSVTVPAPLSTLDGRIKLQARGEGDLRTRGFKVPFRVETLLASEQQRFNTVTSGEFAVPPRPEAAVASPPAGLPELKADVALNEVRLVLPRLELRAPPPMVPDSRIHKIEESKAPPAPALRYAVRVFTPKGQPMLLHSNLAAAPVPLEIDVRAETAKELYGFVAVHDYGLELFRRKARIQSFVLDLKGERELDGRINFTLPQYTIQMLLTGTAARPQIQFISDPPLDPEKITAVLVFGRPIESLDASERTSAAGVGAALANGAIGLASLYFLASTPIENINYNSATGEVIAQLRVGKGTTFDVGASSEQIESVGLTKKLGKNWQLSTKVSDPQSLETASLRSVIEWFKRY